MSNGQEERLDIFRCFVLHDIGGFGVIEDIKWFDEYRFLSRIDVLPIKKERYGQGTYSTRKTANRLIFVMSMICYLLVKWYSGRGHSYFREHFIGQKLVYAPKCKMISIYFCFPGRVKTDLIRHRTDDLFVNTCAYVHRLKSVIWVKGGGGWLDEYANDGCSIDWLPEQCTSPHSPIPSLLFHFRSV